MVPLSDFSLTEASGEAFSSDTLHGKVWVADLVFTSCPSICPTMSSTMANLHRRVTNDDVRFVSISVDPEVDTPEVFDAYADRYSADRSRWHFLTGAPEDVNRVIHQSFRLPAGDRIDRDDGSYDMLHTGQFILIDQHMNMRGLYETDRDGLDALERDIARLRSEP